MDAPARQVQLPCACANLRRAARAVTQLYDAELRAAGLTLTQLTLLQALDRTGAVTQGRIGALLCMDSTTLTRTLRPLVANRWIAAAQGADRRERHLQLTARGRGQLKRALPHWERAQSRLRAQLGAASWNNLQSILTAAAEAAVAA